MIRLNPPTRLRLLPLVLAIGWGAGAQAQSLLDLYQSARGYDATYQSAKAQFDATLAKADQAKALLLPKVSLGLSSSRTNLESSSNPATAQDRVYGAQTATLSGSQPLYRPADWAAYQQGIKGGEAAGAALKAAEQDLIVRLSQAYFDVLASSDTLQFVKAQKTAVQEQLASAKRNFEVGTATITDTREAQARYDLVLAQEIAADNDLRVKSLALVQLAGLPSAQPKSVVVPIALSDVTPNDVNAWVAQSKLENPTLQQLQVSLDVAKLETSKAQAGHLPTLDLIGSYQATTNNGTSISITNSGSNVTTVNLSLNIPVFAGFSTQNRIRETVALEAKARTDLEGSQRSVAQATRAAFYGVQSGLGQVKALEAAEVSSQSALDANKLGYQVGVRINIDVLNSQSQLFDTKAKLAKARYDVLVGGLKLRQASGSLKVEDLEQVNALLAK
jgi:outer membrane protein